MRFHFFQTVPSEFNPRPDLKKLFRHSINIEDGTRERRRSFGEPRKLLYLGELRAIVTGPTGRS
jgi:hypothetical protein